MKQVEWRYSKNVYVYHLSTLTSFNNNMHKEGGKITIFYTNTYILPVSFVHANWNNFIADVKAE